MDTMVPEKKLTDNRLSDLDKKVDVGFAQVGKEFEKIDERFASVHKRFEQVDARFDKVDARFEQVDARFDKVDARFEKVEGKIESGLKELREEMNPRFAEINGALFALHRLLFRVSIGGGAGLGLLVIGAILR
jgi:DNA anti-recombination protein RmuC